MIVRESIGENFNRRDIKLNKNSNKKLDKIIILDLDETLVHINSTNREGLSKLEIYKNPKYYDLRQRIVRIFTYDITDSNNVTGKGEKSSLWGVIRPYLYEFLEYIFNNFSMVIVWSAGVKKYVDEIVRFIFRDFRMPDIVMSREDCVNKKGTYEKPIMTIPEKFPEFKNIITLNNTIIVDDRLDNFNSNPNNGILIPPYDPETTIEGLSSMKDDNLNKLMKWFETKEFKNSSDVRKLNKKNIFSPIK